ncbi:Hypothetical protein CINCED_3A006049 [Cinara cedri]|uniref:Uncharacterized protein n=1 Tax=Cinara cedri TaxID=506608 RepID=A0A5E4NFH2_9HEMI|nr:Hypothetical protein CINCED_3A006049 [Cinara cedri]
MGKPRKNALSVLNAAVADVKVKANIKEPCRNNIPLSSSQENITKNYRCAWCSGNGHKLGDNCNQIVKERRKMCSPKKVVSEKTGNYDDPESSRSIKFRTTSQRYSPCDYD